MIETDVMIAGGGPVGLTLGIDLGQRGNTAMIVETRAGPTQHPKATLVGARSMEIYRRWGLEDAIFERALPPDVNYAVIFCTRLADRELHRVASPSISEVRNRPEGAETRWRELAWSPYGKTQIGQQALEPVLINAAQNTNGTDLRHGWTLTDHTDRGSHVISTIKNEETGETQQVKSRYLVACDGGSSPIRKRLGIRFGGRGPWRSNVSLHFRSPDFLETHGKGLGNLYFVFAPDAFGVFTAINGADLWTYQLYFLDPTRETKNIDASEVLFRAVGKPFDFELRNVTHWQHHQSVAPRWREGNVFLAGDAAHLFAPTGGVGMNTGIADAANLAWKLDAVLKEWGGADLLDSYEAERRAVAWRNSQRSMTNSDTIDFVMAQVPETIEEVGPDADAARARLTDNIKWMARQFNSAGAHLGHRYAASPITLGDGTLEPPDDFSNVVQSTWPGCRAPHVWLDKKHTTLDWFGDRFVIVSSSQCEEIAVQIASDMTLAGIPARVQLCDLESVRAAYEAPLVLVRPDGHVAWRGDTAPPEGFVARITGRTE